MTVAERQKATSEVGHQSPPPSPYTAYSHMHRQTDRQVSSQTDVQTHTLIDRQTDDERDTDSHIDRQTQTGRQAG